MGVGWGGVEWGWGGVDVGGRMYTPVNCLNKKSKMTCKVLLHFKY